MPFKSEKQRRFLWAEHPEIAKKWADKYPESNKNLPMYANSDSKEKARHSVEKRTKVSYTIDTRISDVISAYVNNRPDNSLTISRTNSSQQEKTADSRQEKVTMPANSKPVYAGEEHENNQSPVDIPEDKNISGANSTPDESGKTQPGNVINDLLTKLSVVLSPHIEQTMENMNAEAEGRVARRIQKNRGVKSYPCAAPAIPLPMGMAQNQPQQAQNQQPMRPVGGGSHPQFNPINSYGGLSLSGQLNGNAAFGAKNSPDSSKTAAIIKQATRSITLGKLTDISETDTAVLNELDEEFADEMAYKYHKESSRMLPIDINIKTSIEKWAGKQLGLWDRIRMKRERGEKPAKPGDKDYPDSKNWKKVTSISEKEAGTPAWQRAEGKNEEGGLNAKGRASYNKATGGNLKAPVTESNPKGKRAKRQNSFCARMCGMKRVNTGAKTKSDPDSRINKSLRKWNCKCSSAHAFGEKVSNAAAIRIGGKVIPWLTQAVARAGSGARAGVGLADDVARATASATSILPAAGSKGMQALQNVVHGAYSHPAAKYVADHTRTSLRAMYDAVKQMPGTNAAIMQKIAPRLKELQVNATAAQRMAAGHLHVPRPKPAGFSDVSGPDWANLSRSFDNYDAAARAAGRL